LLCPRLRSQPAQARLVTSALGFNRGASATSPILLVADLLTALPGGDDAAAGMVFLLAADVVDHTIQPFLLDAERAVGPLPPKLNAWCEAVRDKVRRGTFHLLRRFGNRNRPAQPQQAMDVILRPVEGDRPAPQLPDLLPDAGVDRLLNPRGEQRRAVPGCPDVMDVDVDAGSGHAWFLLAIA